MPRSESIKKYFYVDKVSQMIPEAMGRIARSRLRHVYAFHMWHELFVERGKENVELLVLPLH